MYFQPPLFVTFSHILVNWLNEKGRYLSCDLFFKSANNIYIFSIVYSNVHLPVFFYCTCTVLYDQKTIACEFDNNILVIFMCFIDQPVYAQPEKTKTRKGKLTRSIRIFV